MAVHQRAIIDIVCDVCRAEGFTVSKNDGKRKSAVVDVIASRDEGEGKKSLAFQCWEGEARINGRQVEDFVRKIHSLDLEGGVYVSSKGFTEDAEFMARKLKIELWDLRKLKEQLARISPEQTARIPWTLPVSKMTASKVFT